DDARSVEYQAATDDNVVLRLFRLGSNRARQSSDCQTRQHHQRDDQDRRARKRQRNLSVHYTAPFLCSFSPDPGPRRRRVLPPCQDTRVGYLLIYSNPAPNLLPNAVRACTAIVGAARVGGIGRVRLLPGGSREQGRRGTLI